MEDPILTAQLVRHEGLRLKPYRDTVGKLTIGVGRNLDDLGITESEAMVLLDGDVQRVTAELTAQAPWWSMLDPARQRVLANMCFNMGWPRLSAFKRFLAALQIGNFTLAADEMKQSKWYTQVGARGVELETLMRFGDVPTIGTVR